MHIFAELYEKVVREFWVRTFSKCVPVSIISIYSQAIKSKIAYATDTWTTPQMVYTFAYTIGCFINEDWEIIECVVCKGTF